MKRLLLGLLLLTLPGCFSLSRPEARIIDAGPLPILDEVVEAVENKAEATEELLVVQVSLVKEAEELVVDFPELDLQPTLARLREIMNLLQDTLDPLIEDYTPPGRSLPNVVSADIVEEAVEAYRETAHIYRTAAATYLVERKKYESKREKALVRAAGAKAEPSWLFRAAKIALLFLLAAGTLVGSMLVFVSYGRFFGRITLVLGAIITASVGVFLYIQAVLLIGAVILGLALIGGVGYGAWKYSTQKKLVSVIQTIRSVLPADEKGALDARLETYMGEGLKDEVKRIKKVDGIKSA